MKAASTFIILMCILALARAQEKTPEGMVRYTTGYEFAEGIYTNFEMVIAANPIPAARVVTDVDLFDREFYEKITSAKEIVIYDDNGVKMEIKTSKIWGYGRNGALYINVGSAFHRISMV